MGATPEILWHYTGVDGLKGMLDGIMWATDARFLNDSRELAEAVDAQRDSLINGGGPGPVATLYRNLMRTGLAGVATLPTGVHVACWSRARDQLSQWRGYTNGPGYAIGLSRDALESVAAHNNARLLDVTYGPIASQPLPEAIRPSGVAFGERGAQILSSPEELAAFKNEAFAEEQELRLVKYVADTDRARDVEVRSGRLGLIPYTKLRFPPEEISEIMVGPGDYQALRAIAVKELLDRLDLKAAVSTSHAPFRA